MPKSIVTQHSGTLYSEDFLCRGITETPEWQAIGAEELASTAAHLRDLLRRFPMDQSPNESQTEDDLIWPVLRTVGWEAWLRQQNLSPSGRGAVPDGILFADVAAKDRANALPEEWRRYRFGAAILESKRLDARSADRRAAGARRRRRPRNCFDTCAAWRKPRTAIFAGAC